MSKPDRAEVVKLGRGLYALPDADYSVPAQKAMSIPQKTRVESILSAAITEGVDEWKSPVFEPGKSYLVDIPDDDAVCAAPELKSAEARWSRAW
jgi:hypothetical protein